MEYKIVLMLSFGLFCSEAFHKPAQEKPTKDKIDPFLASGHEHVHRLCQGGLGCGAIKTRWNRTYVPENFHLEADINRLYENDTTLDSTKENSSSTEEGQSGDYEGGFEVPDSNPDSQNETSTTITFERRGEGEVENNYTLPTFTFLSDHSKAEMDRAVDILCKGIRNCSTDQGKFEKDGNSEILEARNDDVLVIIIALTGAVAIISLSTIFVAVYCYGRGRRDRQNSVDEEVGDGFEFVDLTFHSSPPPPPPSPVSLHLEEEVGNSNYIQVTEL